jgi:uncharacterized protein YfaS (alpha-2-macroglobulin family)
VVVPLPAGLEVENPRLATSAGRQRVRLSAADRVEFLDDRVLLFCSAEERPRRYAWLLRAVAAGDFDRPPVQASCMYDPEVASVNGGARIEVVR